MVLGRYPVLSVAKARERATAELAKAMAGADPALDVRIHKSADATFATLAEEVMTTKR